MTDHENDFSEACDYAPPNCRATSARALMQVAPETRPQGATPDDLSAVAAQLVEAACRACDGDREAARAQIAHAVALLQHTPSLGSTAARVATLRESQVTGEGLLDSDARRPMGQIGADVLQGSGEQRALTASSSQQLDHTRLRRVLSYIAANIDDDLTLADLAGIAGYSAFHFARKFTLAMGVSPYRYVSCMRLARAMAEVANGKLPLAEIALNAHFSSQASFTRAFHRATGMTPKKYQRSWIVAASGKTEQVG